MVEAPTYTLNEDTRPAICAIGVKNTAKLLAKMSIDEILKYSILQLAGVYFILFQFIWCAVNARLEPIRKDAKRSHLEGSDPYRGGCKENNSDPSDPGGYQHSLLLGLKIIDCPV